MEKIKILGLGIDSFNMSQTLNEIESFIKDKNKYYSIFTSNVDMLLRSIKDVDLRKSLENADILTPDGMPIVKTSGFAWLWRLVQEPRRLWKRYLIHDMRIFYYFGLQFFTKRFEE